MTKFALSDIYTVAAAQ